MRVHLVYLPSAVMSGSDRVTNQGAALHERRLSAKNSATTPACFFVLFLFCLFSYFMEIIAGTLRLKLANGCTCFPLRRLCLCVTSSRTARRRCCASSLCKLSACARGPGGVVRRGGMIVALTHQLLFHGCLVKKLADLISGGGGGCERYKAPCRRVIGGISLSRYTQLNIFHPSLIVKYNSRSLIRQIM